MEQIHFLHKNMEKLNSIKVREKLRGKGLTMFTPMDFRRLFNVSGYSVKNYLNRHLKSGLLIKLKNGLYALRENIPPQYAIANRLYLPSYISFETALAYYHIIPETVYTVFSATPKASREFEAADTDYVYHRLKQRLFFGYTMVEIGGVKVQMAEPAKAVADYLYFVALKKKTLNDRMDLRGVKLRELSKIVRAFRIIAMNNLLESIHDK
jgi:predicted transcriptional regulator of viral defense system